MSLSEKHRGLLRQKKDLATKMADVLAKEDAEELTAEQAAEQFKTLEAEIAALDSKIARTETALRAEAAAVAKADDDDDDKDDEEKAEGDDDDDDDKDDDKKALRVSRRFQTRVEPRPRKSPSYTPREPRGVKAARLLIALGHQRMHHMSTEKAAEWCDNRFGDHQVSRALNSLVTGEGGALIPQDFLADLIELLRANTVVRGAGPMTVGMPMGNLTIPRLAGGASAAYQGELDDITVSQERFDDVNLVAKKLACLVPVSNDLIRRAPIGVEEIVRDDLVQTIARREDLAFLRGDGTDKGPIGFRHLCAPANVITVPAMGGTNPGDALNAILAAASSAILALQNGMSRMIRPVWFMAPNVARFISLARDQVGGFYFKDEIEAGRWEGYPIKITQQLPTNLSIGAGTSGTEIYFADMADIILADTYNVVVDASDVASYNDGTGMVSSFQRDQSLFRVIAEHDLNIRHLQSLVVLLTSDWTVAGMTGGPGAPFSTQPLNPTWSQAGAVRPAVSTGANAPPTLTDPK